MWHQEPRNTSAASQRAGAASFEALYREYHGQLHRYCLAMTRRDPVAEDIAQETLLRALLHWDELDPNRSAWPWLKKVATRLVYDHTRNRRDVCSAPGDERVVPDAAGGHADRDLVRQMLGGLPERQRTAVTLRYLDDWRSAEIAAVLDLPRPAVEQLLLRARRSLQTEYRRLSGDRLRLALWPLVGWALRVRHRVARSAGMVGDAWLPSTGAAADSLSALVIAGALTVGATLAANPPARAMGAAGYDADVLRVALAEPAREPSHRTTTIPASRGRTMSVSRSAARAAPEAATPPASREDLDLAASPTLPGGSGGPVARSSVRRDEKGVRSDHYLLIDIDGEPGGGGSETGINCDGGIVTGTTCSAYDAVVGAVPEEP